MDFLDAPARALRPAVEHFDAIPGYQANGAAKAVPWNIRFLDDSLDAIYANDLVLVGADTGAGKTTFSSHLAAGAVAQGLEVAHFALEAHDGEVQQRQVYAEVAKLAWATRCEGVERLSFGRWANGRAHPRIHRFDPECLAKVKAQSLGHLMRYRGKRYCVGDMRREFLEGCREANLIVFDHAHYVDAENGEGENQVIADVSHTLRDCALELGIPVVVVGHLRKRGAGSRNGALMPSIDDFHGSSNLAKNATRIIALAPAYDRDHAPPGIAFTYMKTLKDRWDGVKGDAAVLRFNLRRAHYEDDYLLGRFDFTGAKFEEFTRDELPAWCSCPELHALPTE